MDVKEGQKAPEFTLPATGGRTIALTDFAGKQTVILYFYPTDLTEAEREEMRFIDAVLPDVTAAGAVILGVSPDLIQSHEDLRLSQDLGFPLLADEDHAICERYGVWTEKFRDQTHYMGVDRSTFVIDREGDIVRIWHNVAFSDNYDEIMRIVRLLGG